MAASFPTSIKSFTTKTDDLDYPLAEHINSPQDEIVALETLLGVNGGSWISEGQMLNGKLSVSVATNDLTVSLVTIAGTAASSTNPIYVRINNTVHKITGALSVTKNDGTNWCNSGGAELATKEVDYFVYLGYNATDGVVIGFSRIPYGTQYSSFSATSTNDKYCAISTITNAAAADYYTVIGRFAATLSAGAAYTWTVPTFTNANLIQRPIYNTRWLTYTSTITWTAGAAPNTPTTSNMGYYLNNDLCIVQLFVIYTNAGTTVTLASATIPFSASPVNQSASGFLTNGSAVGLTYADLSAGALRLVCASSTINRYSAKSTYQY